MPLATLHLLRLRDPFSIPAFIQQLQQSPSISVILASKPRYHVIKAAKLDADTLNSAWDLLLLLQTPDANLPKALRTQVLSEYKLTVGVPSRILKNYPEHNVKLVIEAPNVKLTGALERSQQQTKKDAQNLELSRDLLQFMEQLTQEYGDRPVTMLNLLWFTEDGKPSYAKYGQAFKEVAGRRGGDAKLVGNVVPPPEGTNDSRGGSKRPSQDWWNEFSLVHYPSIRAFCDMIAGEDYQDINSQHRLGALRDTLLICTTEVGLDSKRRKVKL